MASLVPIRPVRLLVHAKALAEHQAGAGRPRATDLRRAVSAAYYAAFHGVNERVTQQIAPRSSPEDHYRLCRSLEHGRLAEVCGWVKGQPGSGKQHVRPLLDQIRQDHEVLELATHIARLQEARHQADYDHLYVPDKASTLAHLSRAERVLEILRPEQLSPQLEAFFALVVLHTQLR